jgi:hypothetical protein
MGLWERHDGHLTFRYLLCLRDMAVEVGCGRLGSVSFPRVCFLFFASRDRGGVRRIFVSDLWMSQVARCCCLNPIGEFACSPLGGAFRWVVCEAEETCYEVLLVCSPVQWRASRQKQPDTCWEFTSRVPSRRNQSRGAVLMGSEPRMLCMGFVRMACPEGEEDRQSSIWSGDPMEKDGGHICILDSRPTPSVCPGVPASPNGQPPRHVLDFVECQTRYANWRIRARPSDSDLVGPWWWCTATLVWDDSVLLFVGW